MGGGASRVSSPVSSDPRVTVTVASVEVNSVGEFVQPVGRTASGAEVEFHISAGGFSAVEAGGGGQLCLLELASIATWEARGAEVVLAKVDGGEPVVFTCCDERAAFAVVRELEATCHKLAAEMQMPTVTPLYTAPPTGEEALAAQIQALLVPMTARLKDSVATLWVAAESKVAEALLLSFEWRQHAAATPPISPLAARPVSSSVDPVAASIAVDSMLQVSQHPPAV
jgi:hypothetical protein